MVGPNGTVVATPQSRRPSFGEPWPDGRAGHAFGSGNPTAAGTCGALVRRRQHARGLADLRPGPVPRPTTADLTALHAAAQSPGGARRGQAARCLAAARWARLNKPIPCSAARSCLSRPHAHLVGSVPTRWATERAGIPGGARRGFPARQPRAAAPPPPSAQPPPQPSAPQQPAAAGMRSTGSCHGNPACGGCGQQRCRGPRAPLRWKGRYGRRPHARVPRVARCWSARRGWTPVP